MGRVVIDVYYVLALFSSHDNVNAVRTVSGTISAQSDKR
jgi:hypothetical protein